MVAKFEQAPPHPLIHRLLVESGHSVDERYPPGFYALPNGNGTKHWEEIVPIAFKKSRAFDMLAQVRSKLFLLSGTFWGFVATLGAMVVLGFEIVQDPSAASLVPEQFRPYLPFLTMVVAPKLFQWLKDHQGEKEKNATAERIEWARAVAIINGETPDSASVPVPSGAPLAASAKLPIPRDITGLPPSEKP
jgi:hypothetical protein